MAGQSDIDRLIELGLNRYGAGDLDGALLMWEEALAIDPDNAQANSYVDYLRQNYDLLTSGDPSLEEAPESQFAIEEDPEYLIEIIPGGESDPSMATEQMTLPPAAQLVSLDIDAGWDLEETHDMRSVAPGVDSIDDDAAAEPPAREPVNFDDATREYHGVLRKPAPAAPEPIEGDFHSDQYTGGFNSPQATPVGFASQETGIRKRDLGFVQPTSQPASDDDLELGRYQADATADDDLIESLPRPRPAKVEPESGEILLPPKSTREMPPNTRQPASRDSAAFSQAEVMLPHAPTRELTPAELRARVSTTQEPLATAPTRELSADLVARTVSPPPANAPTRELPSDVGRRALDPIISAPTRELGLRTGGKPLANPTDDDAPTGQSDVRAIRAIAARENGAVARERAASAGDGTRHDIVLPFDPIAAQAAQILDDVDAEAPPDESADDRTRRRVTRLLQLASDWSEAGEVDKAVSAVDLALSEDPNSALGQKLITRNKDTIMSLFQSYLGNLDRMPQLSKPLHELANAPISPRAAFLLSRIDGTLTIDELLDVSGMPRLEAYRHLCQLYLRGILR